MSVRCCDPVAMKKAAEGQRLFKVKRLRLNAFNALDVGLDLIEITLNDVAIGTVALFFVLLVSLLGMGGGNASFWACL